MLITIVKQFFSSLHRIFWI